MNKAVLFLAALGASTALCAPVPAKKTEKRDTIPIARVLTFRLLPGNAGRFYPEGG